MSSTAIASPSASNCIGVQVLPSGAGAVPRAAAGMAMARCGRLAASVNGGPPAVLAGLALPAAGGRGDDGALVPAGGRGRAGEGRNHAALAVAGGIPLAGGRRLPGTTRAAGVASAIAGGGGDDRPLGCTGRRRRLGERRHAGAVRSGGSRVCMGVRSRARDPEALQHRRRGRGRCRRQAGRVRGAGHSGECGSRRQRREPQLGSGEEHRSPPGG